MKNNSSFRRCLSCPGLRPAILSAFLVFASGLHPRVAPAQDNPSAGDLAHVGGEMDAYLRYMQILGAGTDYSWSIRPLSEERVVRLLADTAVDIWNQGPARRSRSERSAYIHLLPPTISARGNSSFPHGSGDGAIWAGKGLTGSFSAGISSRFGPLSLDVVPLAFISQNAGFGLSSGLGECPPCRDPVSPEFIDRPIRFGTSSYGRVAIGQSALRITGLGFQAAFSNENLAWGPARSYPFLIGPNAAGFPHLSLATSRPRDIRIGKVTGQVLYGRLSQSKFSPVTGDRYYFSATETGRVRFASGLSFAIQPVGITGVEVGVSRFFHTIWPRTGIPSFFFREPFETFLKAGRSSRGLSEEEGGISNQLASVFARWVFPRAAFEIFGEYGREDHSFDFRDIVQEPDHSRSYTLGATKLFNRTPSGFSAVRGELMNFQLPTLKRLGRGEGAIYTHSLLRQGHTNEGQLLGADIAGDAAASTIAIDRYTRTGRTTISLERKIERERGSFQESGISVPKSTDVSYALKWDRLRKLRKFDIRTLVGGVAELNRGFSRDAFNLNAILELKYRME